MRVQNASDPAAAYACQCLGVRWGRGGVRADPCGFAEPNMDGHLDGDGGKLALHRAVLTLSKSGEDAQASACVSRLCMPGLT